MAKNCVLIFFLIFENGASLGDYDFIIVGSGSSGAVIANRLSENPHWKILLLEAGVAEDALAKIPMAVPFLQFTNYNWKYLMERQDNACLAMDGHQCAWPRGKALGGSSVINYMIYTRGNPTDYDRWASLGNPGWSYKDVLPYFLKSERADLENSDESFHNKSGYLNVQNGYLTEFAEAFLRAGEETGHKIIDFNSMEQIGFGYVQGTLNKGRRDSVATAFLNIKRKNLEVVTSAFVTKILIDGQKATGVEFTKNQQTFRVKTRKEIILSAGVFNSPQLLILSGIGPKNHLKELGIPLIKDLPVGETLYDHIAYLGLHFLTNSSELFASELFNPLNYFQWKLKGTGPFSTLGSIQALAFVKTDASQEVGDFPDIEFMLSLSIPSDFGLVFRKVLRISDDFYGKFFRPLEFKSCWAIFPMLLHPKSKGRLKLRSRNPYDPPLLFGNYLDKDEDVETLLAGIKFAIELSKTEAFQKFNSTLSPILVPGCEEFSSDEYWRCALKYLTTSIYHQTVTCKMGPESDPTSVVDHELKVHGIEGLRVADTSVIPVSLSGHTNAPAIMIGEKLADLIKKQVVGDFDAVIRIK